MRKVATEGEQMRDRERKSGRDKGQASMEERIVSSTNGTQTTVYPHAKESGWTLISRHIIKLTPMDQQLKYKRNTYIKLLEKNRGESS